MKSGVLDILLELLLTVFILFYIPVMLYGLEVERIAGEAVRMYASEFTENVCNQKQINEKNLEHLYKSLSRTGLRYHVCLEVNSSDGIYPNDIIIEDIKKHGYFNLEPYDYIEVIIQSAGDTAGVRMAEALNPCLGSDWIKVIEGSMVQGGKK